MTRGGTIRLVQKRTWWSLLTELEQGKRTKKTAAVDSLALWTWTRNEVGKCRDRFEDVSGVLSAKLPNEIPLPRVGVCVEIYGFVGKAGLTATLLVSFLLSRKPFFPFQIFCCLPQPSPFFVPSSLPYTSLFSLFPSPFLPTAGQPQLSLVLSQLFPVTLLRRFFFCH